jgi:hypothetical protein
MEEQIARLTALWKSGRDKFRSFYTVLEEVRVEIGDDALALWCVKNLRVSLGIITDTRKVLNEADARMVRDQLATANRAERERKRKEMAEAREASFRHKLDAAEKTKHIAETLAGAQRIRASTRANKQKLQSKADPKAQSQKLVKGISNLALTKLANRYAKAEELCMRGREQWIEGSIAKALILAAARARYQADQEFGAWLTETGIELHYKDRSALINLGRLGETSLREILARTDSQSYRMIWEENRPPLSVIDREGSTQIGFDSAVKPVPLTN